MLPTLPRGDPEHTGVLIAVLALCLLGTKFLALSAIPSRLPLTTQEFHETCHFITFYFMIKDSQTLLYVTPQCQSQLTPKMKANAIPRLLSSSV